MGQDERPKKIRKSLDSAYQKLKNCKMEKKTIYKSQEEKLEKH